jgi:hypothetical protein
VDLKARPRPRCLIDDQARGRRENADVILSELPLMTIYIEHDELLVEKLRRQIDSLGSWMAEVGMVKTGTLVNEGKLEELRADDAN